MLNNTFNQKEFSSVPEEGKWFRVNPLGIDQNLFKEKRDDEKQEVVRGFILAAFEVMKQNPKYARSFNTMFPVKTWYWKTVEELIEMAKTLGDHNADWIEQSLEWAQAIANGEPWYSVCNGCDCAKHFRLLTSEDGTITYVGGGREWTIDYSRGEISPIKLSLDRKVNFIVPLVVAYDD